MYYGHWLQTLSPTSWHTSIISSITAKTSDNHGTGVCTYRWIVSIVQVKFTEENTREICLSMQYWNLAVFTNTDKCYLIFICLRTDCSIRIFSDCSIRVLQYYQYKHTVTQYLCKFLLAWHLWWGWLAHAALF